MELEKISNTFEQIGMIISTSGSAGLAGSLLDDGAFSTRSVIGGWVGRMMCNLPASAILN